MLGIVLGLKKVGGPEGGGADISDGLMNVGVETVGTVGTVGTMGAGRRTCECPMCYHSVSHPCLECGCPSLASRSSSTTSSSLSPIFLVNVLH